MTEIKQEKKRYWLKLEKNFLDSKFIKIIKNLDNGTEYILFYLALMLESIENIGHLRLSELVPYNEKTLASLTGINVDIVRSALKLFSEFGMIVVLEDGTLFLPDVPAMTGKESESAERVRLYRAKKAIENKVVKEPKDGALRQRQFRAKQTCSKFQHIPFIEDSVNNNRYNGNYYVVFKRDKMKCAICNSTENLCVHHIDGYDELNPANSNENKMITLCRSCHRQAHEGAEIDELLLESIGYYDSNESNELCNDSVTKCNDNKEKEEEKEEEKQVDKQVECITTEKPTDINTENNSGQALNITHLSKPKKSKQEKPESVSQEKKEDAPDKPSKSPKQKHGEYKHVLLTSDEYLRLCEEWGEPELLRMIKELDEGIEVKGYKYKNHNLALRKWKANEKNQRNGYSKPLPVQTRTAFLDMED